jgi:hypothetical protein
MNPHTAPLLARIAAAAAGWLAACSASLAAAEPYSLKVSEEVAGATPAVLGYNLGHTVPGSNTHDWLRYSEVNGFRVWSSPAHIEPRDDGGDWGDGVADRDAFLARRAALRADPLNHEYINWPYFEDNYNAVMDGMNRLSMRDVLEYAKARDLTPLVMIHRGVGRSPFRDSGDRLDWASRWETWQHFYAQAFWLGRHYGVERFQVYNEPDHRINLRMEQPEYIERLKLSSDAVQAALADVNRLYGKALTPRVSAPVTVAAVTMFLPRPDREGPDQRAAERGWGELAMEHRRSPFFEDVGPGFSNFQVYAYQQYGRNGPGYADQYRQMVQLVADANGGERLPVIITEFNVLANYMFRRTEDTMHTPSRAARLGSILVNLVNQQADELYVFKFGQTTHPSVDYTAKNGNFWQENEVAPFHTGGGTRGAETYRLIMRAFQKDRQLLRPPQWTGPVPEETWTGASHDPATGMYHLFIVTERADKATKLELDLSAWGIQTPNLAILEEVSMARHGAVRGLVTIPEDGRLRLELSPETAWHLAIPREAFQFALSPAVADAHVRAGGAGGRNFGAERILKVAGHASKAGDRHARYFKFRPEGLPDKAPRRVLLRLHVRGTDAREVLPAHVYALPAAVWEELAITAENAPNLQLDGGTMRLIADNRVQGAGIEALIQGTLTATNTPQDQFIDVTDFVREHRGECTFLITQEVRYPGELVYKGEMQIMAREAGPAHAPQLVFLY